MSSYTVFFFKISFMFLNIFSMRLIFGLEDKKKSLGVWIEMRKMNLINPVLDPRKKTNKQTNTAD